jgi:hypothetical protein
VNRRDGASGSPAREGSSRRAVARGLGGRAESPRPSVSISAISRRSPDRRRLLPAAAGLSVLFHFLVLAVAISLPPLVFKAPVAGPRVATEVDAAAPALVLWLPSLGAPPADREQRSTARTTSEPVRLSRAGKHGIARAPTREPGMGTAAGVSADGGSAEAESRSTGGGSIAAAFRAGYSDPRLYPPKPPPVQAILGNEFARPYVPRLQECIDSLYVVDQRARGRGFDHRPHSAGARSGRTGYGGGGRSPRISATCCSPHAPSAA